MKITVEIRTIYNIPASPMKASASVVLDDSFVIRNVRLIQTEEKRFVSMPAYRGQKGDWLSNCHPITTEFRQQIESAVIQAYDEFDKE